MAGRWESSSSNAWGSSSWNRQPDQWSGRRSQVAVSATRPVEASATSTDDPGSILFDEQTFRDMTQDELNEAREENEQEVPPEKKSKGYCHVQRATKLGSSFKNYRRAVVNLHNKMMKSNFFYVVA